MIDHEGREFETGSPEVEAGGRTGATVALVMFWGFIALVASLHFLRPDLSPLGTFISDYATGRFGTLMTIAFLAFAAGLAALVTSLFSASPFGSKPWAALVFLSVSGLLMILVAVFPSDPPGAPQTTAGEIHDQVSGLFFLSLMVAMLILSVRLWRSNLLAGPFTSLLWLAIAAPILLTLTFTVLESRGIVGLGQRIYVLSLLSWLILTAYGLRTREFSTERQV